VFVLGIIGIGWSWSNSQVLETSGVSLSAKVGQLRAQVAEIEKKIEAAKEGKKDTEKLQQELKGAKRQLQDAVERQAELKAKQSQTRETRNDSDFVSVSYKRK